MSLSPEERAQQIIEKECEAKTGVLNLNNLGLIEMPVKWSNNSVPTNRC